MEIIKDIFYVGVNDKKLDLFEGQYIVPNGMAYNSYLIKDKKIAVLDSVDKNFGDEWLNNVESILGGEKVDYLIVSHMEPDHSANITAFAEKYPDAKIVSSSKAFTMMKNFFGTDYADRRVVINEGDELDLGEHKLTFVSAPMVHWPEVMMSYDKISKTLFSADAFGKFGALDTDEDWACEARRYYFGIVGKYGAQVQSVLKKLENIEVERICALHGPILTENLDYYIDLYKTWSSYGTESEGVVINYTSVYGNTKKAVEILAKELESKGIKVAVNDLARCDMAEAVEDAFRYGKVVFATTTYNGDIFPFMKEFINHLTERNFQNKVIGIIENGSWAPLADKIIKGMLEKSKNLTFASTGVKILSSIKQENIEQIKALATEIANY